MKVNVLYVGKNGERLNFNDVKVGYFSRQLIASNLDGVALLRSSQITNFSIVSDNVLDLYGKPNAQGVSSIFRIFADSEQIAGLAQAVAREVYL